MTSPRPAQRARLRAFTLVELLIVVGIVAILSAIAIPNLIQAQARAKVSRALSDMRALRTALESYAVDHNVYPLNAGGIGLSGALFYLTAPREYISAIPADVFMPDAIYFYLAGGNVVPPGEFGSYALASAGPDQTIQTTLSGTVAYDPTNGVASAGDIVMTHKGIYQQ